MARQVEALARGQQAIALAAAQAELGAAAEAAAAERRAALVLRASLGAAGEELGSQGRSRRTSNAAGGPASRRASASPERRHRRRSVSFAGGPQDTRCGHSRSRSGARDRSPVARQGEWCGGGGEGSAQPPGAGAAAAWSRGGLQFKALRAALAASQAREAALRARLAEGGRRERAALLAARQAAASTTASRRLEAQVRACPSSHNMLCVGRPGVACAAVCVLAAERERRGDWRLYGVRAEAVQGVRARMLTGRVVWVRPRRSRACAESWRRRSAQRRRWAASARRHSARCSGTRARRK
jgi:hypothetical protein